MSIREWMSTLRDDPSPDKESMNQSDQPISLNPTSPLHQDGSGLTSA